MESYRSEAHEQEGLQAVPMGEHPEAVPHLQVQRTPVSQTPGQQVYWDRSPPHFEYTYATEPLHPGGRSGTIFGLRKPTFILSVLLALAVVAVAVIGGVLGTKKTTTSAASCQSLQTAVSSSPTGTTSSPTGTSSAPASATTAATNPISDFSVPFPVTVHLNCPAVNGTTVTSPYLVNSGSYSYKITCSQDCGGENIFPIWAYTMDHCVEACVNMNYVNATDRSCKAVAYRADMSNVTSLGGNCFLKFGACSEPQTQLVDIAHAVLI